MVRAAFVESAESRVSHSLQVHEGMIRAISDGDVEAMDKLITLHRGDLHRLD